MKKRKPFINLLLIVGLIFIAVIACDEADDSVGDSSNTETV